MPVPVMVALPCRRSTPLEDYVATMTGVGNLLQQQGELINKMRELLKENQGEEEDADDKREEKQESSSSSSVWALQHRVQQGQICQEDLLFFWVFF